LSTSSVSVSGGTNDTKYYTSASYKNDEGIVKHTGYEKFSARLNLNQKLNSRLNVKFNNYFSRSIANRGFTGNSNRNNTLGYANAVIESYVDLRPVNGVYPEAPGNAVNPLEIRDRNINNELVTRTINNLDFDYTLLQTHNQKLTAKFNTGIDYFIQDNRIYSPSDSESERQKVSGDPGLNSLTKTSSTVFNLNAYLAHNYSLSSTSDLTSSFGLQYSYAKLNVLNVVASNLAEGPINTSLSSKNDFREFTNFTKNRGFFVQEELNYNNFLNLSASVRADANSTHGDPKKYYYYPKVAGSLRLSELDFWDKDLFNEFKLRVAYGETGNSPLLRAKFNRLVIRNNGNNTGVINSPVKGSPDIKPERIKEVEIGLDFSLPNNLGGVEFSYYNKVSVDLLLQQTLPASSGFTSKFINGGELKADGFEVALNLNPIREDNLDWKTSINFSTNKSKITKLSVQPFNLAGFGNSLGVFRVEEGKSPTQIYGNSTRDQVIKTVNGKQDTTYVTNKAQLGDSNPDYLLNFSSDLTVGNFNFSFLLERKEGGDVVNLTGLLYGSRLADKQWSDQIKAWGTDYLATAFVEDGSYWKLREVSLNYTFDQESLDTFFNGALSRLTIGFSAINLFTITDYNGYDPDVSNFANVAIGGSIDVTPYPSNRSYYFNLSLGL
jgi:outer membrane receptor protein involved in Fe transport